MVCTKYRLYDESPSKLKSLYSRVELSRLIAAHTRINAGNPHSIERLSSRLEVATLIISLNSINKNRGGEAYDNRKCY